MFRLTLFGAARIEGPTGAVAGRIAQRRQLAVLSLLALSAGRRATRDRLIAVFWPDADTERARHNLADSVYIVRKALGDGALVSAGDDLVLDPGIVATDVERFDAAVSAGNDDEAVALYSGSLLDGFHLEEANGFEHWLDGERSRRARAYAEALERLARSRAAEGRHAESAGLWQRLAALEPLNSRIAVEVMRALAVAGDRAGAVRHARTHTTLVESELGGPPDRDVEALALAMRAPADPTSAAEPPVRPSSGPALGAAATTPSSRDARARTRHARTVAAGVVALVLVVAAALGLRDRGVELVPDRVVVLPFRIAPATADDDTGRWIAHTISARLAQAQIADPVLPYETAALARGPQPADAMSTASEFRAGLVVRGSVYRQGDSVSLSGVLIRPGNPSPIAALGPLRVAAPDLAAGVEQLAERVVGALASHLSRRTAAHPYVTHAPTLASFRVADYANSLFLRRDFVNAAAEFRRAYELDTAATGFLLWAAISHMNAEQGFAVDSILGDLRHSRERLGVFDAAQYDWLAAIRRGDRAGALEEARRAHAVAPTSGLGGYQLGMELLASGRPREARHVLRALDPARGWLKGWERYWWRLGRAHHLLGAHEAERRVATSVPAEHRPAASVIEAHALAAQGKTDALTRLLRTDGRYTLAYTATKELMTHGGDSAAVADVAHLGLRLLRGMPGSPGGAASVARRGYEARFLVHAGELREARDLLEQLVREVPRNQLFICWLGIVAAKLGDRSTAEAALRQLESFASSRETGLNLARRAAILSHLAPDEPEAVLGLLERSHREGMSLSDLHDETPFVEMRGRHAAIERFFAPRG